MNDDPLAVTPPAARLLGRRILSIDRAAGRVALQFTAAPEFLNRHGKVMGGMLAAMLDSTVGCAVIAALGDGRSVVTLEMKVTYLRPAEAGLIHARGHLVHRGGSIAFAEGVLSGPGGHDVASASATLRIVAPRE